MDFDFIILGAGPGGYEAAIAAGKHGKKVAVVEERDIGGTCLNRGCIPTKTMIHSTELVRELQHGEAIGVLGGAGLSIDVPALFARKDEVVSTLRSGIAQLFKMNKVTLLEGRGTITAKNTVCVNGTEYTAENIIIATGSTPARPPIPGLDSEGVVTSDELLTEAKPYKSLTIIGGGVIGMEFATVYNAMGCQVTVIEAMDRILPTMDKELSQNLSMIMKKRGVTIITGAHVDSIARAADGLACTYTAKEKEESVTAEGVLVSIGRRPNTKDVWAESLAIEAERGYIHVNENFETAEKGIYAIGDVVAGGIQLAHVATAQGIYVVEQLCGETPTQDVHVVPSCIYTSPEIAAVGMTEAQAKEAGIPVKTKKALMSANGKSVIEMADRGFMKLVFNADTDVLLGAQLMCSRATDMIPELTCAVVNGLTRAQLAKGIRPHPTFCEALTGALE